MNEPQALSLPVSAYASAVIRLPAEIGIEAASELHRELIAHIEEPAPVVLEASEVAHIHSAALQLFCLFCSDRRERGWQTDWHAPSNALRSAAALLGVTTLLNLAREAR